MSAIGAMGSSCNSFLSLLNDLHYDETIQKRIITKAMNISARSSLVIISSVFGILSLLYIYI